MRRHSTASGLCLALVCVVTFSLGCAGDAEQASDNGAPAAEIIATTGTDGDSPIVIPLERIAGTKIVAEYTGQLYAGKLDALHARFSDEFRQSFSRDDLQRLYDVMRERFGQETSLVSVQRRESGDYRAFARFAVFDRYEGVVQIGWILRDDDSIAGLSLEASPKKPLPADAP